MILLFSQVTYQKKRSRTLEEQLKKCELKVSVNDTQLAEQVLVFIVVYFKRYILFTISMNFIDVLIQITCYCE